MSHPYTDIESNSNFTVREFKNDINPIELMWHRDQEDREVEILEGNGWSFQFDNQLPFVLSKGDHICIPACVWHRVIRGSNSLKIKIKF